MQSINCWAITCRFIDYDDGTGGVGRPILQQLRGKAYYVASLFWYMARIRFVKLGEVLGASRAYGELILSAGSSTQVEIFPTVEILLVFCGTFAKLNQKFFIEYLYYK